MKKLLLFLTCSFLWTLSTNAQEIGVRFGDASGGNVAIDAVFSAGEFSRIHADVSFGSGGVGIDALWDFVYQPLGGEDLKWYAGAGPTVFIGDAFGLGVAGEIGLEYRFKDFPLAIGADWRPGLLLVQETDFVAGNFGFNVRWIF